MKKIAKAKSGKSFGMLSVKAGIDKNPKPSAADRIAGAKMNAGKAKYGAKVGAKKVVAKKPIKKAQAGDNVKNYDQEGSMLPEAVVTASRMTDKPTKTASSQKSKPSNSYKAIIKRSNKMNKNQSGFSRMNPRKMGFEDGGEVSMAKKGTSVKKSMGKCKMGC
jgi:hypothetical protein